jgi:hypothetical protein
LSERTGLAFQTGAAASVLSGLIIIGFGRIMPARTIRGTRALEKVLGFEEFLTRVESDRFERLVKTPEMFEKFLPFAMALGVEKNWTNAFDGIYTQPPTWYQGANFAEFRHGHDLRAAQVRRLRVQQQRKQRLVRRVFRRRLRRRRWQRVLTVRSSSVCSRLLRITVVSDGLAPA